MVAGIRVRDPKEGLSASFSTRHVQHHHLICRLNVSGVVVAGSYLDIEILVDFDGVSEEENVLHQTRKFPHVPQFFQYAGSLRCHGLFGGRIGLLLRLALEARHLRVESRT